MGLIEQNKLWGERGPDDRLPHNGDSRRWKEQINQRILRNPQNKDARSASSLLLDYFKPDSDNNINMP